MRVGFLEVVRRAQRRVLAQVLTGAFALKEVGHARGVVAPGLDEQPGQGLVHGVALAAGCGVPYGAEEPVLQVAAQTQQVRVPLPPVVDPVEPLVVQLVQDVESQLQIVTEGVRRRHRLRRDRDDPSFAQCRTYGGRDHAPRLWQRRAQRA